MSEPVIEDAAVAESVEAPVEGGSEEVKEEVASDAIVNEENESTSNVAEANVESEESKGEAK